MNHFGREKLSNMQQLQKQKCVIWGQTQNNGVKEKFRICKASYSSKFLLVAIYLQDEVFTKIAYLQKESRVSDAQLY